MGAYQTMLRAAQLLPSPLVLELRGMLMATFLEAGLETREATELTEECLFEIEES